MVLVGHRGDPRHAPENTLASFETAWRHGRRAVECDVRASRDGVPIVFHDATLARVTDGRGPVANQSWKRLRALDAGAWFHRRFAGEPVASLPGALATCRRRSLALFLDLKVTGIERRVHRMVRAAGMTRRCRLASSHVSALNIFRRLRPRVPLYRVTGFHQPITPRLIASARRLGLTGVIAYARSVTPAVVRRVAAARLELYVWTVRRRAEEVRFRRMGVTGIMTERCGRRPTTDAWH